MTDNASNNKRIAKNSLFLSLRMVVVMVISLYTTRVVLQVLGIVDYGVNNVVCGFVAMFQFLNTSMGNGIQRFYNYEYGKNGDEGANKVFCTAIYIQALASFVIAVLVELFGLWYMHNKMVIPIERMVAAEWIFQFAVIKFVLGIMQSPFYAAIIAHERLDVYAIIQVFDSLLNLGIVVLLNYLDGDKLVLFGLLGLIISIANFAIYVIYSRRKFVEIRFRRGFEKNLFKKMLGFSGWNLFGSFSGVMENQGINLVLNLFFGPVVNAAKGIANQINGAVQAFVLNITTPVRPQVTQSYARGDYKRTMSLTYGISKMSSAIIMMFAIPACTEIDYLLHLWLGEAIPDHTKLFTILVLLTSLVNNLNAAISNVVHATGIMRDYQLLGSIVRLCSVPLAFVLIKFYDMPELALGAVLICAVFTHLVSLIISKRIFGLHLREYTINVVFPIVLVSCVSLIIVWSSHCFLTEGILRVIVSSVFSIISVCSLFFYVAFNDGERQLTFQMVRPLLAKFKNKCIK